MPRNEKVVHVSTVHLWNDSRIFGRMCLSLARHGHDVIVIAVAGSERVVDGVRIMPVASTGSRVSRLGGRVPRAAVTAWSMRAAVYHLHDPELIPLIPSFASGAPR
jgi:hypothetical protein